MITVACGMCKAQIKPLDYDDHISWHVRLLELLRSLADAANGTVARVEALEAELETARSIRLEQMEGM